MLFKSKAIYFQLLTRTIEEKWKKILPNDVKTVPQVKEQTRIPNKNISASATLATLRQADKVSQSVSQTDEQTDGQTDGQTGPINHSSAVESFPISALPETRDM
jgi:hypothetical protein